MLEFFLLLTCVTNPRTDLCNAVPNLTLFKSNAEAWDICHETKAEVVCSVYKFQLKPRTCPSNLNEFDCYLAIIGKGPLVVTMTKAAPDSPQSLDLP